MALTLQEASKMFDIPAEVLRQYEKDGLLRRAKVNGKEVTYEEEDFGQLGLVRFLLSAGFNQKETKRYLELTEDNKTNENKTNEEQVRMLRRQRGELLGDIHEKQKILDQLDYMIWKKKRG